MTGNKVMITTTKRRREWRPYCPEPRSVRECIAKINRSVGEWERSTEENIYRWGRWLIWLKQKLPHGEFEKRIKETRFKSVRTARNAMMYVGDCESAGKLVPYHPNRWVKSATVAVLEPPEGSEQHVPRSERPRHDSEPLNWNAQDCAEELLKIFEKLTQRRKIEEMEDVASRFDDLVREYIDSRKEDRLTIRSGGDDDIDGDEFSTVG